MNNWLTWSLLSAVFAGTTAVLAKIGVTGVDSNFATAIRTTVILLFTWLIASFTRSDWSFATVSRRTWFFLALSGLATGLSWLCYFRAWRVRSSWPSNRHEARHIAGLTLEKMPHKRLRNMESLPSLLSKWPLIRQLREHADGTGLERNGARKM